MDDTSNEWMMDKWMRRDDTRWMEEWFDYRTGVPLVGRFNLSDSS